MAKTEYTALFEEFWKAYPRKVSKAPAFKAWQKNIDEQDAFQPRQVISDIEKRTRMKYWPFDQTKIPHAATWINAHRWEDEGWEDEIKTRGHEDGPTHIVPEVKAPIEHEYVCDGWQMMINRLTLRYIMGCNGLSKEKLDEVVKEKNAVYAEMKAAIEEEIAGAETEVAKKAKRHEMAELVADTLMRRLDMVTGKSLRDRVIAASRKNRSKAA